MFKIRLRKPKLLVAICLATVFFTSVVLSISPLSVNAQNSLNKSSKDFPNKATYNKVNAAGKKIATKLCADRGPQSGNEAPECREMYNDEYVYLAWKKCNTQKKDKKKACYDQFVAKNNTLGKARKAAGNDPGDKTDATSDQTVAGGAAADLTAKTKNLNGFDDVCGNSEDNDENVRIHFNFGCLGPGYDIKLHGALNPIEDIVYAIIRFMALGVGIIVVISMIVAGIQYTSSEGNPEVTQEAKNRARFTMFGLFLYIFAYTIMQYLVPGGLFK